MTSDKKYFGKSLRGVLFWIVCALIFNLVIARHMGMDLGLKFLAGYLIEMSLSVDNLFVFLIIFSFFKLTPAQEKKALFWGVLGAIVFRIMFITAGISLIQKFAWLTEVLGGVLLITAIKTAFQKNEDMNLDHHPIVKWLSPYLSPLLLAIIVIEISDIIFAIDSIPAVLGITTHPLIVVSSNIFAILGLRSLFFVLRHYLAYLAYLHIGLAIILGFVGVKMLASPWVHIPTGVSLGIVLTTLAATVGMSLGARK